MSEVNNDYFTIERSSDGTSFSKIGIVQGSGNTTVKQSYSFDDVSPLSLSLIHISEPTRPY